MPSRRYWLNTLKCLVRTTARSTTFQARVPKPSRSLEDASSPTTKTQKLKKTETFTKKRAKFINVQRHKASCGPVAIANVIKWYGLKTSYAVVLDWCEGIRAYSHSEGMWPFQMRYVFLTLKIPHRVRKTFTVEEMDEHLKSGGSLILVYDTSKDGHAVFIDQSSPAGFRAWNYKKKSAPFMSRETVKKAIKISTRKKGGLYVFLFNHLDIKK